MTRINLHGLIAFEYGSNFDINLRTPKDVIKALEIQCVGITNRFRELAKKRCNYQIIVDGKEINLMDLNAMKIKPIEIDIVPFIHGAFITALITVAITWISSNIALVSAIIAVATAAISILTMPKPESQKPISVSTRGSSGSFVFSNKVNAASQGVPVPVGYGRLLCGSQVIMSTFKSFSVRVRSNDQMVRGNEGQSIWHNSI
jgi:predicted phage tail protein